MRSRKHILERDHARTVGEHIFKQQIRKISRRRDYNRCIRISFFFYSSLVLCFLATLLYDSKIFLKNVVEPTFGHAKYSCLHHCFRATKFTEIILNGTAQYTQRNLFIFTNNKVFHNMRFLERHFTGITIEKITQLAELWFDYACIYANKFITIPRDTLRRM